MRRKGLKDANHSNNRTLSREQPEDPQWAGFRLMKVESGGMVLCFHARRKGHPTPVSRCSAATWILLAPIRTVNGESQDADSPGVLPRSVAAHTAEDMPMRVSFPQASSGTRDLPAEARGYRRHVIMRRMTSWKLGFRGTKEATWSFFSIQTFCCWRT